MPTTEIFVQSQLPRWAEILIQQGVDTQGLYPGEVNWRARQETYRIFCSAARRGIDVETVIGYMRSGGHSHQLWDQLSTRERKNGQRTYQVGLHSLLKTLRQIWGRARDFLRSSIKNLTVTDLNCDGAEVLGWAKQWRLALAASTCGMTPLQAQVMEFISIEHLARDYSTVTAPCSAVADFCGVSKRTAWKALRALVEDGMLVKISAGSSVLKAHKAAIFQISDPDAYFGKTNRSSSVQVKSTNDQQKPLNKPSSSSSVPMRGVLGLPKGRRPRKSRTRKAKEIPFRLRVMEAFGLPLDDFKFSE